MLKGTCDLSAVVETRRILRASMATTGVGARPTRVVANQRSSTIAYGIVGTRCVKRQASRQTYFARPLYPVDSIWTFHAALRPTM